MAHEDHPETHSTIAVIPARGGSKGIPRKNLVPIGGLPMIVYTIRAALAVPRIGAVLVSTDDGEIGEICRAEGARVVERPPELATDESPTEPAVVHVLNGWKAERERDPEWVVLLQPTSPLRDSRDIEEAFRILDVTGADCVLSVVERREFRWERRGDWGFPRWDIAHRPRRQDLTPDYVENGAIYISRSSYYREGGNRLGGKIALAVMSPEHSVDVDEPADLRLVDCLMGIRGLKHG